MVKPTTPTPVSVASDPNWSLRDWQSFVQRLIALYGPDAKMSTNGGHNNVDLEVTTHG